MTHNYDNANEEEGYLAGMTPKEKELLGGEKAVASKAQEFGLTEDHLFHLLRGGEIVDPASTKIWLIGETQDITLECRAQLLVRATLTSLINPTVLRGVDGTKPTMVDFLEEHFVLGLNDDPDLNFNFLGGLAMLFSKPFEAHTEQMQKEISLTLGHMQHILGQNFSLVQEDGALEPAVFIERLRVPFLRYMHNEYLPFLRRKAELEFKEFEEEQVQRDLRIKTAQSYMQWFYKESGYGSRERAHQLLNLMIDGEFTVENLQAMDANTARTFKDIGNILLDFRTEQIRREEVGKEYKDWSAIVELIGQTGE